MNVFIRLILIGLVALPQGWCCVVQMGDACCNTPNVVTAEQQPLNCVCCKRRAPEVCLSESTDKKEDRIPRSCECHFQFQIAVPTSPPCVIVAAVESGFPELFGADSSCRSRHLVSVVPLRPNISLQILHSSWQC